MATTTVSLYRGDNRTIKLVVKDPLGVAVNITGARIRMTIASMPTAVVKDSYGGITQVVFTDPVNGKAEVYLVPADTNTKDVGTYPFDVEMQLSSKVYTLVAGLFQLEADVTV